MRNETICVRGTYKPKDGEPAILPINQSTTYVYEDGDYLADLFSLKEVGHIYSRITNPTVAELEGKVNMLEGGVGALSAATGHAAMINAVLNLCQQGDHIVSSNSIYGGVFNILSHTLPKFGITTTFVDQEASEDEIKKAFKENTKLLFAETVSNPTVRVLDMKKFSKIAKDMDVPFVVDNTLLTAYLYKPFEHGADISVYSGSKYYDGHGSSLAGFVVDSGKYNYDNGKFPALVEPDLSYHGLSYVKDLGEAAYITKARVQFTRDFGNLLNPFNAFLIHMNMETLHLRMERHSENALKLAKFLETHPKVEKVNYCLLESSVDYNRAKELGITGAGGILSFNIKGENVAKKFTSSLELATLFTHLGDLRTSIIHPASTTHSQLSKEDLIKGGVDESLLRVSVGLENIDDIIDDFKKALDKVK
ncbi:MAG: O-acetylhomoserine aminocarboxypropyltransferase/cysteine synthase family protein [Lachnospirales bacterium]